MVRILLPFAWSLALAAGPLLGSAAAAPPSPTGILWIDWAAEQVAFTLEEADPADTTPEAPRLPATHSIESVEIGRLREEIRLLRDLLEQGVVGRIISLENEVRMLRGALQQQQIAAYGNGTIVPQPGDTPMPQPFSESSSSGLPTPPPMAEPEPPLPTEAFRFTVVDEWGRSPEVAADLGGNASTLIGMAGLVPARSAREDVIALARELRADYEAYDNINIEIFDSERAAQDFAADQSVDPAHHVASISRHKGSGRDLILYLANEQPETVIPE